MIDKVTPKPQLKVFTVNFFIGSVVGFIIGYISAVHLFDNEQARTFELIFGVIIAIATGFFANWLFEKYQIHNQGTVPFIDAKVTGDVFQFKGLVPNTTSAQQAIFKAFEETIKP